MGAFNMPPGCSPSDIPGNDVRDPTNEEEEIAGLIGGRLPSDEEDRVNEIVSDLTDQLISANNTQEEQATTIGYIAAELVIVSDMVDKLIKTNITQEEQTMAIGAIAAELGKFKELLHRVLPLIPGAVPSTITAIRTALEDDQS